MQTRRIMKSQPYTLRTEGFGYPTKAGGFVSLQSEHCLNECPYGKPGDRLYVKEAWKTAQVNDALSPKQMIKACRDAGWKSGKAWAPIEYLADGHRDNFDTFAKQLGRYRHARFMPSDYSRITLEVTDVQVQRLQEISVRDAIAEGAPAVPPFPASVTAPEDHLTGFRKLWESINGPGSWDANPWVWAVSFKVVPR